MSKCKKSGYRIIEWFHKGDLVYTPQRFNKSWLAYGWSDLLQDTPSGFMFLGWTRGFVPTEEDARQIIQNDKECIELWAQHRKALKEAKAKYKGKRIICVD